jgi:hypothetical protein
VSVAAVALDSNGPPMSMCPLLLWVTDKWVGYETNLEVAAVPPMSMCPSLLWVTDKRAEYETI